MSRIAAQEGRLVYVGNLPDDIREREIEDIFIKYGRIRAIDLKTPPRPPAFAFVEYDDPRDAYDSVRGRDGYDFYGARLRVEISRGGARSERPAPGGFGGPPAGGPGGRRGGRPGSGFRLLVRGLPISASWQDLKDHFRRVATPSFADVVRDRGEPLGIVEYERREDAERAIRELDDCEFKNPFDRSYLRLFEEGWGGHGGSGRGRDDFRGRDDRRPDDHGRGREDRRPDDYGRGRDDRRPDDYARGGRGRGDRESPVRDAERSPRGEQQQPPRGRGRSHSRSRSRSPYDGDAGARDDRKRNAAASPERSRSPMDDSRDDQGRRDPRDDRSPRDEQGRDPAPRERSRSRSRSPIGSPDDRSPVRRDDGSRSPPRRDD